MRDLTEFEKGQIVEGRIAGASVTRTVEHLGFSRDTISRTVTEFEKQGKTSSSRSKSGRTSKLTERDRPELNRIVMENHQATTPKVTTELNQHLTNPVSNKTVRHELNKTGYHGRTAIWKPLLSHQSIQKRRRNHKV
ncbi:uncharacterized protein LOC115210567 [Octopus sinensis]|uniref:Uncharacterized protein LOC115210567 n=1 Tax=Octopus sinensis TaxID=2607531 RepID=A0A6P7S9L4_9MOLL|nr:uncharacterized protein LOC115210567 [Octopus sinensis]